MTKVVAAEILNLWSTMSIYDRSILFRQRDFKLHSQYKLSLDEPFSSSNTVLKPFTFRSQRGFAKVATILFSASKTFTDKKGNNNNNKRLALHCIKKCGTYQTIGAWLLLPEMCCLEIIGRKPLSTL